MKLDSAPALFTNTDASSVISQDTAAYEQYRIVCQTNDAFCRPLAPMKFLGILLEAIYHQVQTPIAFNRDESIIEIINVVLKVAYYNKQAQKSITGGNTHQGTFAATVLMTMYQEMLRLICDFNNSSTAVQLQLQMLQVPLEGIHMGLLRFVSTGTKTLLDAEEDAIFKSLKYVISKRTANQAPNSSRGRGLKRNRRF